MLEESDELPEGTRWGSKVARVFDLDARWKVGDMGLSYKSHMWRLLSRLQCPACL